MYNVTKQDLWNLLEERTLSKDQFEEECRITRLSKMLVGQPPPSEGREMLHPQTDIEAQIQGLNDHFRDALTLAILDEALAEEDS